MLRLVEGMISEFLTVFKGDDEPSQVVSGDFRDVLVVTQEVAEISEAGRDPSDRLGAFTFGLGEDRVSCQCVIQCNHSITFMPTG